MKERHALRGGFEGIGPLRGPFSSVRVAFRPVDPLLEERMASLMAEIRAASPPEDLSLSLAVRAIDGFFVNAKGSDPIRDPLSLVRVIEYDPSRQIFLVAGDRDPDPWAVLFWFCFRVFPEDGVACATGGTSDIRLPEEPQEAARSLVALMAGWKDANPSDRLGRLLFRCPTLDPMREHLLSTIGKSRTFLSGGPIDPKGPHRSR